MKSDLACEMTVELTGLLEEDNGFSWKMSLLSYCPLNSNALAYWRRAKPKRALVYGDEGDDRQEACKSDPATP
jgi:hypothetical protein